MAVTVLLGGARSGKSTLAVTLAARAGTQVVYLATAEPRDEEMTRRIETHRKERPSEWLTVEEPLDMVGALERVPENHTVVIDCLTLWVSNLIEQGLDDEDIVRVAEEAARGAARRPGAAFVISNEVGSGLVPMDPLGRRYRDLLGIVNARWCAVAERAFLVVAGRVLELSAATEVLGGPK
jgi:adenosylcobinamide kinase / adenosylcobinamide-phosphate guanylyltransferase